MTEQILLGIIGALLVIIARLVVAYLALKGCRKKQAESLMTALWAKHLGESGLKALERMK